MTNSPPSRRAPECAPAKSALLSVAAVAFTGSPSLYESKRTRHPNVLCLPSAVDAEHYSPRRALADHGAVSRANELQGQVPHPRLGFFGVIDERLDITLLETMADAEPGWHIVMAGPVVKIDPGQLPQRPNIHWLGQQPYELLPQLVAGWDVCLLPFALNESTRFISPTKTLESGCEKRWFSTAGTRALLTAVVNVAGPRQSSPGRQSLAETHSMPDACADAINGERLRRDATASPATAIDKSWPVRSSAATQVRAHNPGGGGAFDTQFAAFRQALDARAAVPLSPRRASSTHCVQLPFRPVQTQEKCE